MLDRAGIAVPDDLKDVVYTGGHDATALAVANERVEAGGLEQRILVHMIDQGTIDSDRIRTIARSDPIEGYPWVVRSRLEPSLVENIVSAFMEIEDPQLLELLRAEGYIRVSDEDYEFIRGEAKRLGLLK
jgi:phosphonate transport system substrate-binding protein